MEKVEEVIREFIEQLDYSELTIQSYRYDLKDFKEYIDKKGKKYLELPVEEVQKLIDSYLKSLTGRGYKPKTINRRCISINRFNKYAGVEEVRAKSVKIQKKIFLENVISSKEVNKLLEHCTDKRDRAMILTLYGTGIRVSELLTIEVSDINKAVITIRGKYGKHREIIVPAKTKKALKEYLEVRPKTKDKRLFLGTGRKTGIVRQTVNYTLNKYAKTSKVAKVKAHPHSIRHLFCKRLSEQGIAIDIISSLAGHESLETTAIYTKRTKNELEEVLNRTFDI